MATMCCTMLHFFRAFTKHFNPKCAAIDSNIKNLCKFCSETVHNPPVIPYKIQYTIYEAMLLKLFFFY